MQHENEDKSAVVPYGSYEKKRRIIEILKAAGIELDPGTGQELAQIGYVVCGFGGYDDLDLSAELHHEIEALEDEMRPWFDDERDE